LQGKVLTEGQWDWEVDDQILRMRPELVHLTASEYVHTINQHLLREARV